MTPTPVRIGIDVGGTFTDIVTVADGQLTVTKVPSTPAVPNEGVVNGIERVVDTTDLDPSTVEFLAHGTTVATNAVLERAWADTALITTKGFGDVLEIGRQARPDLYDLRSTKPAPIVPRHHRFEVEERIDERGRIETPLAESAATAVVRKVATADVESVAVCLLFGFENDVHERRLVTAIEALPDPPEISRSSEVFPEIREYERSLVTALNAALKPVMDRYIGELSTELTALGVPATLRIMQSNGGIIGADNARTRPINTLLSGPAAGVQGAAHVAEQAGYRNVITMDMGGTSCDVSLVEAGEPIIATDVDVGGYPVSVPMIDVHTIGAGGGSIAWLDEGAALRVGPQSAGADPGPMCYGRGGDEPTVTDAHVVLGRIDPTEFLPRSIDPDPATARAGIDEVVAGPMEMDVSAAARGMLQVANANMERALRVVSVERGHDPRDFALVAFGGAGPLHAPTIARSLDVPTVLVPRTAGVLSALGLLLTDLVYEYSTSRVRPWDAVDPAELDDQFAGFEATGRERLTNEGVPDAHISIERALELRYRGQSFTLRVPLDEPRAADACSRIRRRFHERYHARYGHASPDEPIELVTIRLRARGRIDPPDLRMEPPTTDAHPSPRTTRAVHIDGSQQEMPIYDRGTLPVGGTITGPAIVEGKESTILVHGTQTLTVDPFGTAIIETQGNEHHDG